MIIIIHRTFILQKQTMARHNFNALIKTESTDSDKTVTTHFI